MPGCRKMPNVYGGTIQFLNESRYRFRQTLRRLVAERAQSSDPSLVPRRSFLDVIGVSSISQKMSPRLFYNNDAVCTENDAFSNRWMWMALTYRRLNSKAEGPLRE